MGQRTSERLEASLDDAERQGSCLAPTARADRKALRQRSDDVVEPIVGLFAFRATWDRLNPSEKVLYLMRGLGALHPDWIFCGTSAAVAYGLPVSWHLLSNVHVMTSARASSRAKDKIVHHRFAKDMVSVASGVRVTSFWRTVFDCLATIRLPHALAIADAALRLTNTTPWQLVEHLRITYRGHRGVRQAVATALIADGRAESGGESIARAAMYELGFSAPELQVWIANPVEKDRWTRVDYLWFDEHGSLVIGELDGREKTENTLMTHGMTKEEALAQERFRESDLTVLHPSIVRFPFQETLDRHRFSEHLDAHKTPRGPWPEAQPATPYYSELLFLDDWMVLVTRYVTSLRRSAA